MASFGNISKTPDVIEREAVIVFNPPQKELYKNRVPTEPIFV
ncbi:hypothetical protein [Nitrososphaera sp. AFS]|nr:hypothetical protein [Nitrososphaera sp. AFS]